ncbi:MAG TPA: glycosyltransferase family 4 protein, partial [Pirellulales bacterium]|nr:glycosyltransferase family 4 protein [Pirellulales bacterium]
MRIAVCLSHFHPTVGGAERQLFQLAERWAAWGHAPVVLTRSVSGSPRREVIQGIEIRRVISTIPVGPLFGATFLATLTGSLVRLAPRYDVVLAGQGPWEAVACGLAAPWLRKPSVVRIASVGPRGDVAQLTQARASGVWRRAVRRNALFLAPSERAFEELVEYGFPTAKIRRLANGVNVERFCPPAPAEAAPQRERTALFVGRLSAEKNPLAVLRAWKHLGRGQDCRLVIAGAGPLAESLAAYARQESLANVELLGHCHDMPAVYRRASICVQTSPHEGCSNALLEGMAAGLCPVASRVPGNVDLVDHEHDGLLVALDDDRELAGALERLFFDSALREQLAAAARRRVVERHSLDRVARQYVAIFEELLARASGGRQPP